MSLVHNYVLLASTLDDDTVRRFNEVLVQQPSLTYRAQCFVKVEEECGGYKAMEGEVWCLAGNYTDDEDVIRALRSVQWVKPDSLLVMVNHSDDDDWTQLEWRE